MFRVIFKIHYVIPTEQNKNQPNAQMKLRARNHIEKHCTVNKLQTKLLPLDVIHFDVAKLPLVLFIWFNRKKKQTRNSLFHLTIPCGDNGVSCFLMPFRYEYLEIVGYVDHSKHIHLFSLYGFP